MKRYLAILVGVLSVAGLLLLLWILAARWLSPPEGKAVRESRVAKMALSPPEVEAVVQQPGGRYEEKDPRWEWWNEMRRKDELFEWKMPIDFFGQILDENDQPVAGVSVGFSWTDRSSNGSSQAEVVSDVSGKFSLTGKKGKRLIIEWLRKDGYYLSSTGSRFSFEYAAFFENSFHQPNSGAPVIFRMRKMGVAEDLLHRVGEVTFGDRDVALIPLDEEFELQIELINDDSGEGVSWSARVSVIGGGLQISTEEFPFLAPEDGYEPHAVVDEETPKPIRWTNIYQGGVFFVRTADGRFGRIDFRTMAGKRFVRYEVFLNPVPGRRKLEFETSKGAG